jgi:hypothetical protein
VTAAATLCALGHADATAPTEEAMARYRTFAVDWSEPPEPLLGELRRAVVGLPAYARRPISEPLGRVRAQALEDR